MKQVLAAARALGAGRETGATLIEYGLMLGLIALVCFAAVQGLGLGVAGIFPSVTASL